MANELKSPLSRATRDDIRTYENQKKVRNLAGATGLASLATLGVGGYKKSVPMILAGLAGAGASGFAAGEAAKKRGKSLDSIKDRYAVGPKQKVFNLSAILPDRQKVAAIATLEKRAILGSMADSVHHLPQHVGLAIDLLSYPFLFMAAKKGLQAMTQIGAKKELGKALSPKQQISSALSEALGNLQSKLLDVKNPVGKPFARGAEFLLHPWITGPIIAQKGGKELGKKLKYLPNSVSEKIVDGIADKGAFGAVKDQAKGLTDSAKAVAGGVGAGTLGYLVGNRDGSQEKAAFWFGFDKQAGTLNDMIGNPFGKSDTPKPPPPPPPAPASVASAGQTLNSRIGNPFGS